MIRKTLTILSLLGLVLNLATWGASYLDPIYERGHCSLILVAGECVFTRFLGPRPVDKLGWRFGPESYREIGFTTIWTPSFRKSTLGYKLDYVVGIPLWIPSVLFATIFAWSYLPHRLRRKRKKLDLCLKCGYDLRGSSERCPECGTEFQAG